MLMFHKCKKEKRSSGRMKEKGECKWEGETIGKGKGKGKEEMGRGEKVGEEKTKKEKGKEEEKTRNNGAGGPKRKYKRK